MDSTLCKLKIQKNNKMLIGKKVNSVCMYNLCHNIYCILRIAYIYYIILYYIMLLTLNLYRCVRPTELAVQPQ